MEESVENDLLQAIESLSFRVNANEDIDEICSRIPNESASNPSTSSRSSSTSEPLPDEEMEKITSSIFKDLYDTHQTNPSSNDYHRQRFLLAVLGNTEGIKEALKRIKQLLFVGKRLEQVYRSYYRNPDIQLDFVELEQLITAFRRIYSEKWVREVSATRIYHAYCEKLVEICRAKLQYHPHMDHI